jgi:predicted nucleic acid-binding protein
MDEVIVDACCLINLLAAGEVSERLSTLGGKWYVPKAVSTEALYLHVELEDGTINRVLVDLKPLIDDGVLLTCEVNTGAELDLYVDLARRLDDGEAMALAIAKTRSWTLSTDDRKAIRIAHEMSVNVITTPEIMKRWADLALPDPSELSATLNRIELFASFSPAARDPLHGWWRASVIVF